ncbi:prephenate dehydrogenase [Alkalibacter rhizosphaerae]|uniref:Prephenate dehydrogenase n=1 Tax=Alkalibacter rhizosphaerae TaxID=2815577 RepID=A0A975AHL0_9FIRM|nr:prephenate dehydrogenase [Alkalibacter rhizosphaerae]QSX07734.1 prephenate dehydrogenase [Alkalibacter rhizosphaerae]
MEADFTNKRVLIVGLGLMGSAFAAGCKKLGFERVWALDRDQKVLDLARKEGLIDEGVNRPEDLAGEADLVVVCLYLHDALAFLKDSMPLFKEGAILTDIVGVKEKMVEEIRPILRPDVDYIPGHPMAGREKSGALFTSSDIFRGKNYILTPMPENRKENMDFLIQWIEALGFGRILETDPAIHDGKIAFTSQLCHVIAASMVDMTEDAEVTHFEGGSFQDMTRIAMINSAMWAELFVANKKELTAVLDRFIGSLTFFKNAIDKEEVETIVERFDIIGRKREAMGK